MRRHLTASALLLFLVLLGCREEKPQEPPPRIPTQAHLPDITVPPPMMPVSRGLERSSLPPVGSYLLPDKSREVALPSLQEQVTGGEGVRNYELEASLEAVIDFYLKRGYSVTRTPAGATVRPRSGDGLLQVLKQPNRKLRLLFLTETQRPSGAAKPPDPSGAIDPTLH